MNSSSWDVIVIGAGAAGLFAAATAAGRNRRTLLIEKNRKIGVKILMSGGTRCNLTHDTTWKGIADAFGRRQGRFLKFALATLPPDQLVGIFNENGVKTRVESTGKVFPQSDRAIDVRDALARRAREHGATLLTQTAVDGVRKQDRGFEVFAGKEHWTCESIVVTTGGLSYPGCGTTGDGYHWVKELGHTVIAPRPALTPIKVAEPWVRELAGVTIADVQLGIQLHGDLKRKPHGDRNVFRDSFLFTHKGCSGPVVLDASRIVTDPQNNVAKSLVCDWLPEMGEDQFRSKLGSTGLRSTGKQIGNYLSQSIPKRLVAALCHRAGVDFDHSLAELGRKQMARIITEIKHCTLPVTGTLGFAKAEVTAGGISLDEIDHQSMVSRIVPGLYLAGEIMDVDGPIGGFNFQAAFSTGYLAGLHA